MARGKGTANLAASIEPLAGAPLDARDIVPTVADLYIASNWPYKYIGMKTTVTATGETYRLVNLDVTQQNSWVLDGASGQTIQVDTLPTAEESNLGKIYQYIGATGSGLVHGYFYECVFNGSVYFWKETATSSLPTVGIGGGYAPIGTIISYMGTTAPQDYLICDGSTYNIADYKQLSDFFAAQFGSANFFGGDGVTTFKVPDLRGEFLRGTGTNNHTMSGASGYKEGNGANVGVHQSSTWHNRIGGDANDTETKGIYIGFNNTNIRYAPNKDVEIKTTKNITKNQITINKSSNSENADWSDYYTSRPTNTSVLYCIKAVVAGDVYSETERVVGTWIDGKPVYEKTFNITIKDSMGDTTLQNAIPTTTETIIDLKAVHQSNTGAGILNYTNLPSVEIGTEVAGLAIWVNKTNGSATVRCNYSTYFGRVVYATIRYTKTTD